jgi:hypothetical protein
LSSRMPEMDLQSQGKWFIVVFESHWLVRSKCWRELVAHWCCCHGHIIVIWITLTSPLLECRAHHIGTIVFWTPSLRHGPFIKPKFSKLK